MKFYLALVGLCALGLFLGLVPASGAEGSYHSDTKHFQTKEIKCSTCHISHRPQGPHLMKDKAGKSCLSCHKMADIIRWITKDKFAKKDKTKGPFKDHSRDKIFGKNRFFTPPPFRDQGKPVPPGKGWGKPAPPGKEKK